MSAPANSETSETGSRWYVHPITGERFRSVTTALATVARFGLPAWAAGLTARAAFDRLDLLNQAADTTSCNTVDPDDACGRCRECVTTWLIGRADQVRDDAADLGSRLHDAAEEYELWGPGGGVDPDVEPYMAGFLAWKRQWQPSIVATEMTVISHKHGYAGTLDGLVILQHPELLPPQFRHLADKTLVVDYKTGKHLDAPKGWQLNAYANADVVLLPDGTEIPLPEIGGGLILHLRPGKTQIREVLVNDANFAAFLSALAIAKALDTGLNTALSRPHTIKEQP